MNEQSIEISQHEEVMKDLEYQGKTAMLVAIDGKLAGIIAVADTVKESSKAAIQTLKEIGIEVYMVTGIINVQLTQLRSLLILTMYMQRYYQKIRLKL